MDEHHVLPPPLGGHLPDGLQKGLALKAGTKFIFVTGGVVSGLGKGITAASLGRLLKQRGLRVRVQKLDPYLNVDPGTMSPYQHGSQCRPRCRRSPQWPRRRPLPPGSRCAA